MKYVSPCSSAELKQTHDYEAIVASYIISNGDIYKILDTLTDAVRIIVCAPGDYLQIELCVRSHMPSLRVRRQVRASSLIRLGSFTGLDYGGRRVRRHGRWTDKERPSYKRRSDGGTASAPTEVST